MKKKGIVSLITFSLLILIFLLIVIGSFNYYSDSKSESSIKLKEIEILTAISSIRSELISLYVDTNSSLNYSSKLIDANLLIKLNNSQISGISIFEEKYITVLISGFGIQFCSSYEFYLVENTQFNFNGSCINVN